MIYPPPFLSHSRPTSFPETLTGRFLTTPPSTALRCTSLQLLLITSHHARPSVPPPAHQVHDPPRRISRNDRSYRARRRAYFVNLFFLWLTRISSTTMQTFNMRQPCSPSLTHSPAISPVHCRLSGTTGTSSDNLNLNKTSAAAVASRSPKRPPTVSGLPALLPRLPNHHRYHLTPISEDGLSYLHQHSLFFTKTPVPEGEARLNADPPRILALPIFSNKRTHISTLFPMRRIALFALVTARSFHDTRSLWLTRTRAYAQFARSQPLSSRHDANCAHSCTRYVPHPYAQFVLLVEVDEEDEEDGNGMFSNIDNFRSFL
ncbi:hypothetical protein F5887DRAFT_1014578, partial [Amanita rubescens]